MAAKLTPNRLAILKKIVEVGSAVHFNGIGRSGASESVGRKIFSTAVPLGTLGALETLGHLHVAKRDWREVRYEPTQAGIAASKADLPEGFEAPWDAKARKRAEEDAARQKKWAAVAERSGATRGLISTAISYFDQKASHDDLEAAVARYRRAHPEAGADG